MFLNNTKNKCTLYITSLFYLSYIENILRDTNCILICLGKCERKTNLKLSEFSRCCYEITKDK